MEQSKVCTSQVSHRTLAPLSLVVSALLLSPLSPNSVNYNLVSYKTGAEVTLQQTDGFSWARPTTRFLHLRSPCRSF